MLKLAYMAQTPERVDQAPQTQPSEQKVEVRPEQISLPQKLEQATGAQATPHQPAPVVQDDSGQPQIQQPQDDSGGSQTISIPADQATLHKMAQGSPSDATTWLGVFWERVIKRALLVGWRVVVGGKQ